MNYPFLDLPQVRRSVGMTPGRPPSVLHNRYVAEIGAERGAAVEASCNAAGLRTVLRIVKRIGVEDEEDTVLNFVAVSAAVISITC